jgi:hypothetical protein
MYEEIYEQHPIQYWGKLKPHHNHSGRGQWRQRENKYRLCAYGFQCRHCQSYVYTQPDYSGVQNRNHCPFCLRSRHVDHLQPGDRLSACKAVMQPIGLTVKQSHNKYGEGRYGELMLIHQCNECGKISINRVAADDWRDSLMEIYYASSGLALPTQQMLEASGIRLLHAEDLKLVVNQLHGILQN